MWNEPDPNNIDNWTCVYECGADYEAEMVKNYLSNLEIPANILSKRDSSYNLNVGDMALIYVYVPDEFAEKARKSIDAWEESELNDDVNSEEE